MNGFSVFILWISNDGNEALESLMMGGFFIARVCRGRNLFIVAPGQLPLASTRLEKVEPFLMIVYQCL